MNSLKNKINKYFTIRLSFGQVKQMSFVPPAANIQFTYSPIPVEDEKLYFNLKKLENITDMGNESRKKLTRKFQRNSIQKWMREKNNN